VRQSSASLASDGVPFELCIFLGAAKAKRQGTAALLQNVADRLQRDGLPFGPIGTMEHPSEALLLDDNFECSQGEHPSRDYVENMMLVRKQLEAAIAPAHTQRRVFPIKLTRRAYVATQTTLKATCKEGTKLYSRFSRSASRNRLGTHQGQSVEGMQVERGQAKKPCPPLESRCSASGRVPGTPAAAEE